jgi:hypothetical protein
MLRIRASLLVALILVVSIAILAHARPAHRESPSVLADETVLNAPYSAERHFISLMRSADGTTHRTETRGSEARDSKGRTYSADERLWVYLGNEQREMLYRIRDPVASTETKWDSSSKEVKVIHWHPGGQDANVSKAIEAWTILYSTSEKLGVQKLGGFVVEGTRGSYTVTAAQNQNDQPLVVVHESWYCPELKIVILETNDDPRDGTTRKELVNIVRGEPDVTKYRPPSDYVVHDVQIP